ncbi:MAG: conjugal transfer protein TrbE [Proteobacteria bacterium]|nr:MAG: conjugal transfer protein TrbE [Pseudomonadota bacterium]
MLNLKSFRSKKKGLADFLNFGSVIADGVILGKDGSLFGGWFFEGRDVECLDNAELNIIKERVNMALSVRLGTGWTLYADATRLEVDSYPMDPSYFPDDVSSRINNESKEMFQTAGMQFETTHVLMLSYLPPNASESKLYNYMVDDPEKKKTVNLADKHLKHFESVMDLIENDLTNVIRLNRIKSYKTEDGQGNTIIFDHLLQYVNFLVTGMNHPVILPNEFNYIDGILSYRDFVGGLAPKIGKKHIAAVNIGGLPTRSYPAMLSVLDQLSCEYRWNTRYIFMNPQESISHLKSYQRKWKQKIRGFKDQVANRYDGNIDHNAVVKTNEIDEAIHIVENGRARYGYYTSVVILMHEDRKELEYCIKMVEREINNLGFAARREEANLVEAWLGSIPSHTNYNVRRPMINTLNLADLLPLSSVWTGSRECPCPFMEPNSPPLMMCLTGGNTPFRFNLHVDDNGHTLVVGPPGSGKSALLAKIALSWRRYRGATVFAFDRGNSLLPATLGVGGKHYNVAADGSDLAFCPLQNIGESTAELAWAAEWVAECCELQKVEMTAKYRNAIYDALVLLKDSKTKSLTDLKLTLQEAELRNALSSYTMSGNLGPLLDAQVDGLEICDWQVFNLETIMEMGEANSIPVIKYLIHRAEKAALGQPMLVQMDEGWQIFEHPLFKKTLKIWLKTWRKKNVSIMLATQSLSDAANSGIIDVIVETMQTKIFLANSSAKSEASSSFYTKIGLTAKQIEIISYLTPKRDYFATSPEGNRIFQLAMGPLALRYAGVSDLVSTNKLIELVKRNPDNWRQVWEKGVMQ